MNNTEIKKLLSSKSDSKYQDFSASLTPVGRYHFIGVRLPELRAIAKDLVKQDGINALEYLSDDSYEEVLLQCFVIGYARMPLEEKKPYIISYLDKCDSWGLIDSFVSTLKLKKNEAEPMWQWLQILKNNSEPYYIRYILVTMMSKFLDDEHIDDVLKYVISIHSDHYYVEMAQAWLLATACIRYADEVETILQEGQLNKFVHNKTIQKSIESYRISDEEKAKLRGLRK